MDKVNLYVGPEKSEQDKASRYVLDYKYFGTLESLKQILAQIEEPGKYKYRTIIIFEKRYNNFDIDYVMPNDVVYISNEKPYYTQHNGSDGVIHIGYQSDLYVSYYHSFLAMYSNTIDEWNVGWYRIMNQSNTVTLMSIKYIVFDQTNCDPTGTYGITISPGYYELTDNVQSAVGVLMNNTPAAGLIYNRTASYHQIYNPLMEVENQQIETFNGLLYNFGQTVLLSVPGYYGPSGIALREFYISELCTTITSNAFNDGTYYFGLPSPTNPSIRQRPISKMYGNNITLLETNALKNIRIETINFPKLCYLEANSLSDNNLLINLTLPGSLINMDENALNVTGATNFTTINFGEGLGQYLTSPIYLQYCPNLDPVNLGLQFNKLATIEKDTNSIIMTYAVYNAISAAHKAIAINKGWLLQY